MEVQEFKFYVCTKLIECITNPRLNQNTKESLWNTKEKKSDKHRNVQLNLNYPAENNIYNQLK